MINGIHASGRYMSVLGGSASNYINNYSGSQGVGNLRFNTTNQTMEVYDGNYWVTLNMPNATVGLNGVAEEAIDWVRRQMEEEKEMAELAKEHPAIDLALKNLNKAKEQLKITVHLSREHEETTS
jgi:hypothetical protein